MNELFLDFSKLTTNRCDYITGKIIIAVVPFTVREHAGSVFLSKVSAT